jgi:hypothetical protein
LEDLIGDDYVLILELSFFTSDVKREVVGFYMVFFHSSRKIKK